MFCFLPVVFLTDRLLPKREWKNLWLALASLVFYAFGQLLYVPLFLGSVLLNYGAGLYLRGWFSHRKGFVALTVILNLGVLCLFKYTDFLIGNLNLLLGTALPLPGIELPIGISFFTFQGLSYVIDVYRDPESGTDSFRKVLLYIAFFPQLIAGPIVKYHDIATQINCRTTNPAATAAGFQRFITGLGKKLLLSNAAGLIADRVFDTLLPAGGLDWRLAWLGGICYTLQIYFDFSGYSDMAIGMGRMFGFTIRENFHYPYTAASMRDFWRRWHISLSGWFREYLYIPLGGNRQGKWRTERNRMIVFLCTGIWHGANWTFVVWGVVHGLLTVLEDVGVIPVDRLEKSREGRAVCRVYTLLAVMLLFVVFRADSLSDAGALIAAMFTGPETCEGTYLLHELLTPAACVMLIVSVIAAAGLVPAVQRRMEGLSSRGQTVCLGVIRGLSLGLLVLAILDLARGGFNPFLYFQF
ncbi:MAG: MBOAT family O-acyltransferase [Oscillospiraceae bacterium]|nr:MBOAT family O-acyltransferase [Oscillospiraceae bacterium]